MITHRSLTPAPGWWIPLTLQWVSPPRQQPATLSLTPSAPVGLDSDQGMQACHQHHDQLMSARV
jgi:hypothetical protein